MVSTGDLVGLVLVYSYVTTVIIVATLAKERYPASGYRKVIHILVGNIVFLWWVFDSNYVMAFLAAGPFILLLLLVTPRSPVRKLDNSFLKKASAQGHGYGLVFYAISWTILALVLFDDRLVASIGIVAMSYGDGLGGLVGKRYGRRKLWRDKSYVGTAMVACGTFVATLGVIAFYTYLGAMMPSLNVFPYTTAEAVGLAALVGAFVAVVELLSPGEYDNLIVPLSTAIVVLIVQGLLAGGWA
jgi:dolichol kinase